MTKTTPTPLAQLPRNVRKLFSMLQYKRPANSKTEAAFNKRYLRPMGARQDPAGNYWLTIPGNDDILFSSHTDTVHKTQGMQDLLYGGGILSAKDSNCLGADCGVGVWLMLEMAKARVPGAYVFHAEEEIGGRGSDYVATKTPDKIKNKKFAIAFDRAGTDEIITHQYCGRTASDEFAHSLAQILHPLKYGPSEHGSFTDTANYSEIIPECTNLSVGYHKQHQSTEHLDVPHATALLEALCGADWSRLTAHRDPAVREPRTVYKWQNANVGKYDETKWWQSTDSKWHYGEKPADKDKDDYRSWWERRLDDLDGQDKEDFEDYVRREHRAVSEFLEHHGFSKDDIEEHIWSKIGVN